MESLKKDTSWKTHVEGIIILKWDGLDWINLGQDMDK